MWYEGTANAVYQYIDIIESYDPEYIVILTGDYTYEMKPGATYGATRGC